MGACKLPLAPCVQERTRAHDIASIAHRPAALFKWGKDSIHRLSAVTLHPALSTRTGAAFTGCCAAPLYPARSVQAGKGAST